MSKVMQIAAFLRWFRIGSCWFRGRHAGIIALGPYYESCACQERLVNYSIPAVVAPGLQLVPWPAWR